MSEIDELPSWSGRVLQPDETTGNQFPNRLETPPPPRRRGLWLLLRALGLLVLGGAAGVGYYLANRDSNEDVTADSGARSSITSEATETDDVAADGSAPTSTVVPSTSTAPSTTTNGSVPASSVEPTPDNPTGSLRWAVLKNGQVFLRGKVPSEDVANEIVMKSGLVLGPDNVFNEYEIDPSVLRDIPSPIYVEDVILFGFNSVEIEPAFTPILDLGVKLMSLNPNVKITVVGHTDSVGSDQINQRVSEQRVDAVIEYLAEHGADPARLIADPRGEERASDSDDDDVTKLERRAEFIISDLLS